MAHDMASKIHDVICESHEHCGHCRQLLLGWHCVMVEGTYYCGIECAVEADDDDKELDDLEH